MSRIDDYDGEGAVPEGLWWGRYLRATRSKKGHARLVEFAAILDAMPEKRLVSDAIEKPNGDVCFVGAIAKAKGVHHGGTEYNDIWETCEAGKLAGIPWALAWEMARLNDDAWQRLTPEERWHAARRWIDDLLAGMPDPVYENRGSY